MNAREEILTRLREKTKPKPLPPKWESRPDFPDLAGQFEKALTAVHGEVIRSNGLDEAVRALGALLAELQAEKIVVNDETPVTAVNLPDRFPHFTWHIVGQSQGDLRDFCAQADVGVSGGVSALAETGSVVIRSGTGKSRLATLLPPVHIVLFPVAELTADLFTWTAARATPFPSNLTLISGPSKTADIEQTLTIGVHGPKRFIVILY